MALHLIKLCVGIDTIGELEDWIVERRRRPDGVRDGHVHVTRMVPKRAEELTEGGSLYWVIRGQLSCRQAIRAVLPFTDADGTGRCRIVLEPAVIVVSPRPCRPFQGWRYLAAADAPGDLGSAADAVRALPEQMRRELVELGLL